MSVELLDNPRFYGYRVRRQIGGKTYQEYFSLKNSGKRIRGARRADIKAEAQARDEQLAGQQKAARDKAAREVHLDADGQVRGILFRLKREKSGTMTPVFQIGIMSRLTNKIVNTTVSVPRHGMVEGWQMAVDFYCRHKKINRRAKAYRDLIAARPTEAHLKKLTKS